MTQNPKKNEKLPKDFLAETLRNASAISTANVEKLLAACEIISFDKNTQIISEGEIADYLYFITKGIVRVYYYNDGKEIIDWFAEEGCFFGNLYSHIMKKPGVDIYESIEDMTLLRIKYTVMEQLFKDSHEIESAALKIMQEHYVKYVERVHSLKGLAAEEKYHLFTKNYASYINRIPLKFVADYLGITSETLSRIRSSKKSKKAK